METKINKVIFWRPGIDDILGGSEKVAGIPLQMSLWARIFLSEGWEVYCQTLKTESYSKYGMSFIFLRNSYIFARLHLSLLWEFLMMFRLLFRIRPQVFVERGPDRTTFQHAILCKLLGIKFVFFGASDVNFIPGKDTINNSEKDTRLYRKAIRHIKYFVTQNQLQAKTLSDNYGAKSCIIPNLWIPDEDTVYTKKYDVIWVSNLRPLKRAEWIIEAAKSLPQYKFAIVGGIAQKEYFDRIESESQTVNNLDFLGPKPVKEVNTLIAQSRILTCTSEYEGFPNTFIQAWAANVPVISTVDPSGIVKENNLGVIIGNVQELQSSIQEMLETSDIYEKKQEAIQNYFSANHNAESAYNKLMNYIAKE